MPDNPHWLEFPRTDGDIAQWPTKTKKVVDSAGRVNFMRPVDLDEDASVDCRVQVGAAVAKAIGKPGIYSTTDTVLSFTALRGSCICSQIVAGTIRTLRS